MKRWAPRAVALALLAAVLVVLGAGPAAADTLTIRSIDTTDFPEVEVSAIVEGEAIDLSRVQVRENNQLLSDFDVVPIGETSLPVGIVLVIDTSGSMNSGGAIDRAKEAAHQFVDQRPANVQIAIVTFGGGDRVVVNFTSDAGLLHGAIDGLAANRGAETALYDGVRTATGLLNERGDLQPNLVVLSDGADTISTTTLDQAIAAARDAKAAVFSVGVEGSDFSPGAIQRMSAETGGQYFAASDPAALQDAYQQVQTQLQNQYVISYTSQADAPVLQIAVTAPGVQDTAEAPVGSFVAGENTEPETVPDTRGISILNNDLGLWLGVLLALLAAVLAAFAVIMIFVRDEGGLRATLSAYTDTGVASGDVDEEEGGALGFLRGGFLRGAAEATGRFAERRGIQPRVEELLERANLPLRAGEALFFYMGIVILATLAGLLFTQALAGTLIVFLLAVLIPPAVVQFLAGRRRKKFLSQLPDTLQLLSGSLRAGYSLMQGVEAVSQEIDDPMGYELRRIVAESRLGRPLEEALQDAADRMGSDDFSWAVMAIKIQREVGGNLAELLDTVAETMIARERLRREVAALTAEGRISAIILGALPVAMLAILWAINREYVEVLFDETSGQIMLVGGAILAAIGFYWLKKIVEIEI